MFLQLLAYTFRRYTERQLLARLADLTGEQYLKESKTKKIELTLEPDVGLVSCLLAKQMNECVCVPRVVWHCGMLFVSSLSPLQSICKGTAVTFRVHPNPPAHTHTIPSKSHNHISVFISRRVLR